MARARCRGCWESWLCKAISCDVIGNVKKKKKGDDHAPATVRWVDHDVIAIRWNPSRWERPWSKENMDNRMLIATDRKQQKSKRHWWGFKNKKWCSLHGNKKIKKTALIRQELGRQRERCGPWRCWGCGFPLLWVTNLYIDNFISGNTRAFGPPAPQMGWKLQGEPGRAVGPSIIKENNKVLWVMKEGTGYGYLAGLQA